MRKYRLVAFESPKSSYAEAFRKLTSNIGYATLDNPVQVIQITSTLENEGKTQVISNLSASFAEKGKKVLLVDLDLKKSSLHRAFGLLRGKGITDVLTGAVSLEEALETYKHNDLSVDLLTAGTKVDFPETILESKVLETLFTKLRGLYDVILVDSPPVLLTIDPCLIAKLTDGILYAVSFASTKQKEAKAGIAQLLNAKAKIIGTVLVNADARYGLYSGIRYYGKKDYYNGYNDEKDLKEESK
ncbi:MAG: CpsD/CapB family tyrosine-protein kinase [Bacillales bacterium]|jgi:capsular exopolysaccharide synthesis family protein|nr:CpsD/CapB family tyrosine-protein kinase [Bacillales bacterium]